MPKGTKWNKKVLQVENLTNWQTEGSFFKFWFHPRKIEFFSTRASKVFSHWLDDFDLFLFDFLLLVVFSRLQNIKKLAKNWVWLNTSENFTRKDKMSNNGENQLEPTSRNFWFLPDYSEFCGCCSDIFENCVRSCLISKMTDCCFACCNVSSGSPQPQPFTNPSVVDQQPRKQSEDQLMAVLEQGLRAK